MHRLQFFSTRDTQMNVGTILLIFVYVTVGARHLRQLLPPARADAHDSIAAGHHRWVPLSSTSHYFH